MGLSVHVGLLPGGGDSGGSTEYVVLVLWLQIG